MKASFPLSAALALAAPAAHAADRMTVGLSQIGSASGLRAAETP